MTIWVGGLLVLLTIPMMVAVFVVVRGAVILETGRGHAKASSLIASGINFFALTGTGTASMFAVVLGSEPIVAVLVHLVTATTLWCVALHPRALSCELITYLEETTLLHLAGTARKTD